MERLYITKTMSFAMAHRLTDHKGLCANLHGHNYKVEMSIARRDGGLNSQGMVMDYADLKKVWNDYMGYLDHSTMLQDVPQNERLINVLKREGYRLSVVQFNPTCENMVGWIAELLQNALDREYREDGIGMYVVTHIRLWETDTSYTDWWK